VPAHDPRDARLLQVAVFLDELVLPAAFAVAGARLADGTIARIALAAALPLAVAVAWGLRLAPRAERRLGRPADTRRAVGTALEPLSGRGSA
jgi:hypothetical protein